MKNLLSLLLSITVLSTQAHATEWCAAIRGNGELVPAHWSAMARLVEELGLPKVSAGGSSATVSMFFVDAIAGNPYVSRLPDGPQKNKAYAFLIKSLPIFVDTMTREHGLISAFKMAADIQTNGSQVIEDLKKLAADPRSQEQVKMVFGTYWPMLNPQLALNLQVHPDFFQKQLMETLRVFGNFDARTDANLFIRHGLIDFKYFAILLGVIADFYSADAPQDHQETLGEIVRQCSGDFYRQNWSLADGQRQSNVVRMGCEHRFVDLVKKYVNQDLAKFPHRAAFKIAGQRTSVLPTTAIITGKGASDYTDLMKEYNAATVKDYSNFSVNFKDDIWFGYWGKPLDLKRVNMGLNVYRAQKDLKSEKFMQLGMASWFEILSLSPAEPGLANLQPIPMPISRDQVLRELLRPPEQIVRRWETLTYRSNIYSAGGWSDLHPTLVLRASGCNNVIYLTRQDGESVFGQQVFVRLAGLKRQIPFWETIAEGNNQGFKVDGTEAQDTPWNKLYNLGADSSFKRSIKEASAVYCTNWNKFKVFNGQMWDMVTEAYSAPVITSNSSLAVNATSAAQGQSHPGCIVR